MKTKFYFKYKDSETCYSESYFINYMKDNDIDKIDVFEAIKERVEGAFWCKHECFCGDNSQDTCGQQCVNYSPRNGKNGCCRHYTTLMYTHGDKLRLFI